MRYRSRGKTFKIKNMQVKDLPTSDLLAISPYHLGLIGGEMARRMVETAKDYLSQQAVKEVKDAFHQTIDDLTEERG